MWLEKILNVHGQAYSINTFAFCGNVGIIAGNLLLLILYR